MKISSRTAGIGLASKTRSGRVLSVLAAGIVVASALVAGPATAAVGAPTVSGLPAISGTPAVGENLTGANADWSGAVSFTWQWRKCSSTGTNCANIKGATGTSFPSTFPLTSTTYVGSTLRFAVTAKSSSGKTATAVSNPTAPVTNPAAPTNTRRVAIDQVATTPVQGDLLTVTTGDWTGATNVSRQWQRCLNGKCSNIRGATATSYTVVAADAGYTLQVIETATNASGTTKVTSDPTQTVVGIPTTSTVPSISYTGPNVGETLTATEGTWRNATGYTYLWQVCTASTYDSSTCTDVGSENFYTVAYTDYSDAGSYIFLTVAGTNDYFGADNAQNATTSAATPAVVLDAPEALSGPSLSISRANDEFATATVAAPEVNDTVTADPGTWSNLPEDPSANLAYQWQKCTSPTDATTCSDINTVEAAEASFAITTSEFLKWLRVEVTATNDSGSATAYSAISGRVTSVPVLQSDPDPGISNSNGGGVAAPDHGNVLTATAVWDLAVGPVSYQWQSCTDPADDTTCTNIASLATSQTYTVTVGDAGNGLRVVVTAYNSFGSATYTSVITGAVDSNPST